MADHSTDRYRQIAHDLIETNVRLRVISNSMQPLVRSGDEVIAQPIDPATLEVGDVVVVRHGAELITHRLVAIDREGWYLRGDDAIWHDEVIGAEAIVGQVTAILRSDRRIDLQSPGWSIINRRAGRIGRVYWHTTHILQLKRSSINRFQLIVAWLSAAPFRLMTCAIIAGALKRTR